MRPNAPIMMSNIKISAITIARGDITTVIVDIAMVVTTDIIGHVPPPSKPLG